MDLHDTHIDTGKLDLVRELLVKLNQDLDRAAENGKSALHEWSLPTEQFLSKKNFSSVVRDV